MTQSSDETIQLLYKVISDKDKTIDELQKTIEQLNSNIANLTETIKEMKRKLFGISSEKLPQAGGQRMKSWKQSLPKQRK